MPAAVDSPAVISPPPGRWSALDRLLQRAGDRLNPILVKEARQALKSRQFVITFGLVLAIAWAATLISVALYGPEMWYGSVGPRLFFFYYMILAFPLLVVVPFGAMRSLAGEHEDRTYDLLSITALGPCQIISGKLTSAALQILIYVSAVSPCLVFTYLLRGIDLPTITLVLGYTVLWSLGLAMIGLLAGTLSSEKHWQMVLGVAAAAGLLGSFGGACGMAETVLMSPYIPYDSREFWMVVAAMLTGYLSYFALTFFAAAARLTFASANRSTPLRIVMLVQQLLLAGWVAAMWLWVAGTDRLHPGPLLAFLIALAGHWYVMGAFMTGESPELSRRMRRRLPHSLLGRAVLMWFHPGPGTGYVFAISGMLGGILLVLVAVGLLPALEQWVENVRMIDCQTPGPGLSASWSLAEINSLIGAGLAALFYMIIYLGVGLLLLRILRRFARIGTLGAPLINVLLVLVGVFTPLVIQEMTPGMRPAGWTILQLSNVLWTMEWLLEHSPAAGLPIGASEAILVLGVLALAVFLMNVPGIAREMRQIRAERPQRVIEEELALNPLPPPGPTSPWG